MIVIGDVVDFSIWYAKFSFVHVVSKLVHVFSQNVNLMHIKGVFDVKRDIID